MEKKNQVRREEMLGTAPLGKLMLSLAIPSIMAQLINVLYNIVDRMYLGHIPGYGDLALTGVGVAFPILTLIAAFSAFAGMGGAPLASIELGRKNYDRAEKFLGTSVALIIVFAIVLTTVFMIIKEPVLYKFGATDRTIEYAVQYISIYLIGTIFVQLAVGLNTYISAQGQAKIAMASVLIGAVLNIVLDPIFIFLLNLGVRGAALATIISQAVSAAWVVRFLSSEKSAMRIRKKNIRLDKDMMKSIGALGISPFIMQSTESLVLVTLNSNLQIYGGDLYVGSMSILTSIMQLLVVPISGMNQGIQSIISYNYGAKNKARIKGVFMRILIISLCISMTMCTIAMTFPNIFSSLFTDNQELLEITNKVMKIYYLGMTVFGIQMACQTTFVALGQAKVSLFIALLRKVILLAPLAIIFPKFFGVMGVYYAEPVADIISVITTAILFVITWKRVFKDWD